MPPPKFLYSSLVFSMLSQTAIASDLILHRLKIAANPSIDIRNEDVDLIIQDMNKLMRSSAYDWDSRCPEVRFVRDGNVIENSNLATSGTFDELNESRKKYAPAANVLMVFGINCSGVIAAGCGPVGGEPLIARFLSGDAAYYNPQLWLHERGHNVGLNHSEESPYKDNDVEPKIGKRFMFWMLGQGHTGKNADECRAFRSATFASIERTQNSPQTLAAALPTELLMQTGGNSLAATASSQDVNDERTSAQRLGLTVQAYKVVAAPWVGGAPKQAISELSEDDLNSIRALLEKSPTSYHPQAAQIIGMRGKPTDIPLLQKWVEAPVPAAIPGDDSKGTRDAIRQFKQTKIAAPAALGELANRTKSADAVKILKDASKATAVTASQDPVVDAAAKKSAIYSLSNVDTAKAKEYVQDVINLQDGNALNKPVTKETVEAARAVPLTKEERRTLSNKIKD